MTAERQWVTSSSWSFSWRWRGGWANVLYGRQRSTTRLRAAGITAPIQPGRVYWVIVGAASIPFVNAPEVRALTGDDPTAPAWVERHADDLVATLLPGLGEPTRTTPPAPEA